MVLELDSLVTGLVVNERVAQLVHFLSYLHPTLQYVFNIVNMYLKRQSIFIICLEET